MNFFALVRHCLILWTLLVIPLQNSNTDGKVAIIFMVDV